MTTYYFLMMSTISEIDKFFYGFTLPQYSFAQNGKNTKEAIIEEHFGSAR